MHSKHILAVLTLLLTAITQSQAQSIPSFSGAEGFGAVTIGGRGGDVYHVTNLNNSGPGSLREACEAEGPRTVVFDVSGTIYLTEGEPINITNPYITIAGQTAPGKGITIATEGISLTNDVYEVIIRYIRLRRSFDIVKWKDYIGCTAHCQPNPEGDCLSGIDVTKNVIIDHVSTSWGSDENLSIYRRHLDGALPVKNVTIQWCISSEALDAANHAFGGTWGGQGVNYHHNLFANNTARNPSLSFSHFFDYRNNVIFNWRDRSMDGGGREAHVNVINNYYKPGPATGYNWNWGEPLPELKVRIVKPEIRTWSNAEALGLNKKTRYAGPGVIGQWYVEGNVVDGYPEVSQDNWMGKSDVSGNKYTGVQWDGLVEPYPGIGPGLDEAHPEWEGHTMEDHPEWARATEVITHAEWPEDPKDPEDGTDGGMFVMPELPKITTQTAEKAYISVLAGVGCTMPARDAVDLRILDIVKTGNATAGPRENGIIIHPNDVGGYPEIEEIHRPENWDTDQDGMPNEWEVKHDLDPNDASDRNGDYDEDGFTNLEEYLNEKGAFKAVQPIGWHGGKSKRYAELQNWDIAFQPSALDDVNINNSQVEVDAKGQQAGVLNLSGKTSLTISQGWLQVHNALNVGVDCETNVEDQAALNAKDITNDGKVRFIGDASVSVSGTFVNNGTLDISEWNGTLDFALINNGTIIDAQGEISEVPSVKLTSSPQSTIIEVESNIILTAEKQGNATIDKVEFYHDEKLIGTDTEAPYSYDWTQVPSGKYIFSAKAINERISTFSPTLDLTVTAFPSINLSSSADVILLVTDSTEFTFEASDADGTIEAVEFLLDSISLGLDHVAPYSINWGSDSIGTYALQAIATDNVGAQAASEKVLILVKEQSLQAQINLEEGAVKIYPVPASDFLKVKIDKNEVLESGFIITLADLSGTIVRTIKSKELFYEFNVSDLSNGVYLLNVTGSEFNTSKQISKQ